MTEIYYNKGYEDLKSEIREEMCRSMDSFVRIGYLLKVARDTDILKNSPYRNMEEFASAEFHIDKGTASKFMAINDRFSEGGCSDHLLPEYVGLGWSKLSLMLSLPKEIAEEITPEFSKADIQAIKEEYEEEQKVTDIEVLLEGEAEEQKELTLLEKVVHSLGQAKPGLYVDVYGLYDMEFYEKAFREVMSPTGEDMYTGLKVQGIGKYMLSVKENSDTVALIDARSGEKKLYTWDDLAAAWHRIFPQAEDARKAWEITYGKPWTEPEEEKPKVAPVQQPGAEKKAEKKPEKKKSKVIRAGKPEKKAKAEPVPEPEEKNEIPKGKEPENAVNSPVKTDSDDAADGEREDSKAAEMAESENPVSAGKMAAEEKEPENGQGETPENRRNTECGGEISKEEFERRYGEIGDVIDVIQEEYSKGEFGRILEEARKLAELAEAMQDVKMTEDGDGEE